MPTRSIEPKCRCAWADGKNTLMAEYHDTEWGVPVHDDRKLFEFIILEGAQAGLSWNTILQRREGYRAAFDNFDPQIVARYNDRKIQKLLSDPGIIRNRLKVNSAIKNARAFLQVAEVFGSFDRYIWQFVDYKPVQNKWEDHQSIPVVTDTAHKIARDLKTRGFTFMGPVICYAHMQATGMVNDHTTNCFRWKEVARLK